MIVPKLCGRLGNQCFQVAAAIAHARKMQTEWAIPRNTENVRVWPNYFLHNVPRARITFSATRSLYNEQKHSFEPLPNIYDLTLNGYFQSEKYWPTIEDKIEIGTALGFHSCWATHEANGNGYIAVHVRRGDYLQELDKHPVLAMEYYSNAMNYFIQKGASNFKIYTDDINFILNHFFKEVNFSGTPFIEVSKHRDPLTDMRDMYNASGFIIANSTFSLFPALLRLDNPMVVSPAENKWFGPGNSHLETCDLLPERFIKI